MARTSAYIVQQDAKAHCPECGSTCDLLMHESAARNKPAFYICRNDVARRGSTVATICGYVGEVGVGPVPREMV
jgi:hypothetical protein